MHILCAGGVTSGGRWTVLNWRGQRCLVSVLVEALEEVFENIRLWERKYLRS
jgi:hypothetical protein